MVIVCWNMRSKNKKGYWSSTRFYAWLICQCYIGKLFASEITKIQGSIAEKEKAHLKAVSIAKKKEDRSHR